MKFSIKLTLSLKSVLKLASKLNLLYPNNIQFWSGVFYKEVELFRRLQANSPEGDAAALRAKYIDTLYSAIDYYQNLILSLENFYHFNLKFYASEGKRPDRHFFSQSELAMIFENNARTAAPKMQFLSFSNLGYF
mgnify:CR=1 FL=1